MLAPRQRLTGAGCCEGRKAFIVDFIDSKIEHLQLRHCLLADVYEGGEAGVAGIVSVDIKDYQLRQRPLGADVSKGGEAGVAGLVVM